MKTQLRRIALCSFLFCMINPGHAASYKYIRIGSKEDAVTSPTPGIAMMGGGHDLDEAFSWLCNKGNGGDFLILRATGDDEYNSYVNNLCKANSVATLIIPDRAASEDPAVAEIIRRAEVIFIAGGDQANYIRGWQGTPVQTAIKKTSKQESRLVAPAPGSRSKVNSFTARPATSGTIKTCHRLMYY